MTKRCAETKRPGVLVATWVVPVFSLLLLVAGVVSSACDSGGDGSGQTDSTVTSDVAAEDADLGTCLDVTPEEKYPGEPGATALFEVSRASFYDQPFPCDSRLSADGSVEKHLGAKLGAENWPDEMKRIVGATTRITRALGPILRNFVHRRGYRMKAVASE